MQTRDVQIANAARALRELLGGRREQMLADLAELVALESPSEDVAALNRTADWLVEWLAPIGHVSPLAAPDGRRHLLVEPPSAQDRGVLLMCHYDTVWPVGTTAEWPFALDADRASGPGVFDMKASIVCARHVLIALAELGLPRNARLLITADEEIGNRTSRELIEAEAQRTLAALVLEPPLDGGPLKTSRKGRAQGRIVVGGRAAHAGVSPELGVNAIEEIARVVLAVRELADAIPGLSATVGRIEGGGAVNVVPEHAAIEIDVRAWREADMSALEAGLQALRGHDPDARIELAFQLERPPMERVDATGALLARYAVAAAELGLTVAEGATGGGSEGNFMQAAGAPVLDGLGVRGFGPHTREERIELAQFVEQTALIGALVADLSAPRAQR
jgi:glutamate carboxypeptidase